MLQQDPANAQAWDEFVALPHFLPHDLPPKSTVYEYFAQWRDDGTWPELRDTPRPAVRVAVGKGPDPGAGSIDSQTVQAAAIADDRSYGGGQGITGRKRHIV